MKMKRKGKVIRKGSGQGVDSVRKGFGPADCAVVVYGQLLAGTAVLEIN